MGHRQAQLTWATPAHALTAWDCLPGADAEEQRRPTLPLRLSYDLLVRYRQGALDEAGARSALLAELVRCHVQAHATVDRHHRV